MPKATKIWWRHCLFAGLMVILLWVTTASAKQFGTTTPVTETTTDTTHVVQKLTPGQAQKVSAKAIIGTWHRPQSARTLTLRADGSYRLMIGDIVTTGYWRLSAARTLTLTDALGRTSVAQASAHELKFSQADQWLKN
ncbi:hypothetical protein [Lactiplantibacillus mudanjiangensis]|uniref:Uncharacterized protein n=1 Tax=Lactiplantibacillus mudanjiangensis TaxID=1296538 RepID=A0A660DW66_9LACO|nr:hypothetical protein [Lactiplantibacillus mudanjiangensis]VDG26159.1 hypothetical protein MUDAN_IGPPGNFN_01513 [Lactiplantibacillus mudanjiangensis]VDG27309.1 hypothetical protein MUDAN_MDHGFNIF_02205 [Lactiplantibacillus mudanjiangensis]